MSNRKLYLGLATLVVIAGLSVGIAVSMSGHKSTGGNTSMNMSASAVATNKVAIVNYMFSPAAIKIKVGTTVTWTNTDSVGHTVTADTNSTNAPSSMDIAKGKSYSFTFKKAGTYTYRCFPHPYMHGTVEVTSS